MHQCASRTPPAASHAYSYVSGARSNPPGRIRARRWIPGLCRQSGLPSGLREQGSTRMRGGGGRRGRGGGRRARGGRRGGERGEKVQRRGLSGSCAASTCWGGVGGYSAGYRRQRGSSVCGHHHEHAAGRCVRLSNYLRPPLSRLCAPTCWITCVTAAHLEVDVWCSASTTRASAVKVIERLAAPFQLHPPPPMGCAPRQGTHPPHRCPSSQNGRKK